MCASTAGTAESAATCSYDLRTVPVRDPLLGPLLGRFLPIFRTFLGDFTPDRLDSRSLQSLWEWENRVLLEEHYISNVAIPLELE